MLEYFKVNFMRKLFILFMCCFLYSFIPDQEPEFVFIYKRERAGEILPEYIIFKKRTTTYEMFSPNLQRSIIGEWKQIKDTLFLYPQYIYFKGHIKEIETSNFDSVNQKYLKRNDSIIDITDYLSNHSLKENIETLKLINAEIPHDTYILLK